MKTLPGDEGEFSVFHLIIACLIILVALAYMLNVRTGPIEETTGVVLSAGVGASKMGPPPEFVRIRLVDGTVVLARSAPGQRPATIGGTAHVRVYRRLISRTLSYELARVDALKETGRQE